MARKFLTMDGNEAAAHAAYAYTEVATIYPITPSSVMPEHVDEWATAGRKNIFGQKVQVTEMQSEAGAAGAVHGSIAAGAMTSTFTASQGLLLMIPNLYKIAGEGLPAVCNVAARAVCSHALNIFGDHSDVYAARQSGCAMLCESSVQEVMDLTPVAYCAAVKGKLPFINFFDGFRTSHEIQKIQIWDYEDLNDLIDHEAIAEFRRNCLNPTHPRQMGSAQNPDIFFQTREACNPYYDAMPAIVQEYMDKVNAKIGTDYKLFNYYGAPDAEKIIIAMGSVNETIEETIDYLAAKGEKVGVIKVRLYRPFCTEAFLAAIPDSVKQISVLDRTKEPGSIGEPLALDVKAALADSKFKDVPVFSGRYGLGSKDTTPAQIIAVYNNNTKKTFTIGITDDVTNLSLDSGKEIVTTPEGTICCKFWGLGADGTVGANKNSIKIIGDHTDKKVQAYFAYDSKKSGGITVSHLRFGDQPINSAYLINSADFVACHNESYIERYDMVQDLKDGGTFLLNCLWKTQEELDEHIPAKVKQYIAKHNIQFYTIDASSIAQEVGLGNRVSTILQSAFFNLTQIIPGEEALQLMKDAATKSFSRKGEDIVRMNHEAIDKGFTAMTKVEVPAAWADATDTPKTPLFEVKDPELKKFMDNVLVPTNDQHGDDIPVSVFSDYVEGKQPLGSSALEKRGVSLFVPEWQPDKCIQCNQCAYVCPHAVIRPVALTEAEAEAAPASMKLVDLRGMPGYKFGITVSAYDCSGCGSCVNICPAGAKDPARKAIVMKPFEGQKTEHFAFEYAAELPEKAEVIEKFKDTTVKGSQFKKPYLEFSGACAGCGETPYAKLVTQLFGNKMYIANATGCSSIWGNSAPSTPYCKDAEGKGPAWSNSLFEDNAEFGYGMMLANKQIRERLLVDVDKIAAVAPEDVKAKAQAWMETYNDATTNAAPAAELAAILSGVKLDDAEAQKAVEDVLGDKDYLAKKSQWIFGGDGWAYDIGFGGLDHVLAANEDVNIMVFDTEVYSNTGGQASKSTRTGAIAKFAASGKTVKKKDLAGIAMSYGYVYVAQVAMGADYNQTLKAIHEAEAYKGPSIIIAYAPCINHGIKGGLTIAMTEEKRAVTSGYWHLFRYNPALIAEGKNPFTLDSKDPTEEYKDFIMNEVRYSSLKRSFPEKADALFDQSAVEAKERLEHLKRLVALYAPEE